MIQTSHAKFEMKLRHLVFDYLRHLLFISLFELHICNVANAIIYILQFFFSQYCIDTLHYIFNFQNCRSDLSAHEHPTKNRAILGNNDPYWTLWQSNLCSMRANQTESQQTLRCWITKQSQCVADERRHLSSLCPPQQSHSRASSHPQTERYEHDSDQRTGCVHIDLRFMSNRFISAWRHRPAGTHTYIQLTNSNWLPHNAM